MSENHQGYIYATREERTLRQTKLGQAVEILRAIVREHARFDIANNDGYMAVHSIVWPDEEWDLELTGYDGKSIPENSVKDLQNREYAVLEGQLNVYDGEETVTGMTVQTQPPNVFGHDGKPVDTAQLDPVIVDLRTYHAALATRTDA